MHIFFAFLLVVACFAKRKHRHIGNELSNLDIEFQRLLAQFDDFDENAIGNDFTEKQVSEKAGEQAVACRCPGYFQEQCEAESAQGCVWTDAGSSNGPWCQCRSVLNSGVAPPPPGGSDPTISGGKDNIPQLAYIAGGKTDESNKSLLGLGDIAKSVSGTRGNESNEMKQGLLNNIAGGSGNTASKLYSSRIGDPELENRNKGPVIGGGRKSADDQVTVQVPEGFYDHVRNVKKKSSGPAILSQAESNGAAVTFALERIAGALEVIAETMVKADN